MTKYERNDKLIKVLKKDKPNYFNEVNGSKVFEKYKKTSWQTSEEMIE